jgi:ribosomal protein L40E
MECEVMVSNEEIKRMLENRRKGIKTDAKKERTTPVSPSTGRKPMKSRAHTCESCGGENPPDAKYCIKCGATLQAPEKVEEKKPVEAPDTLPRSGMDGIDYRTCPNCSHQNKPQAKFCVVCGHKLDEVEVTPSTTSLLDQVPDTEEEEPVVDQPPEEETPAVAELIDEESAPDETQKISLLSRKVPDEELSAEEAPAETTTEEDIAMEPVEDVAGEEEVEGVAEVEEVASEEVPEIATTETTPEEAALLGETPVEASEEEAELPQVKTFKFGQDSLEVDEEPAAEVLAEEEVADDAASTGAESPADPMEKIKKAKELLDIGAITEEEFEEIKKKYLALI